MNVLNQRLTAALFLLLTFSLASFAQLSINSGGNQYTIDFDNSMSGVNNSSLSGSGFSASPSAGQLNSNAWAATGMSDGDVAFGGAGTSGDLARGPSTGGESTGGYYAFDIGGGNYAFGVQPGGSDWTPGTLTLRIQNNTGLFITSLDVGYNIYVLNNADRSNSFNFAHSEDNVSYTDEATLNFTSTAPADGSPAWLSTNRSITLSGLAIAPGDFYYLKWLGDDFGGSGSRDEFALDDISVTGTTTDPSIITSTSGPLSYSNTEVGSNSVEQSYTVSGTNLVSNLVLTAPTHYQVSTTSGSGYSSSVSLVPTSGTVSATTIYARMSPASIGTYTGNITHTSTSAVQKNISVSGQADVQPVCSYSDDFSDNDFSSFPAWSGDDGNFSVISAGTVPSGNASTDGNCLSTDASSGIVALTTPSDITDEWRFSIATGDFSPSSNNFVGVVLMSDIALTGEIAVNGSGTSWEGYFLRIGDSGSDFVSLYRRTGQSSHKVGDFSTPSFSLHALRDGLNLRVTRNGTTGEFELFYSTGFDYDVVPSTSAGTLTDANHSTSSYFGVFQKINDLDPDRRVYFDNFCTFDRTYTWIATSGSADWQVATNWSPQRTSPSATDILLFDQGGTSTATNVPSQTIRQLLISNNTSISLIAASGATRTLSITGTTGTDLSVDANSTLRFDSNGDALAISLSSDATGLISGLVQFDKTSGLDPSHRLIADAVGAITFQNGATFHAKNCSGNPFGSSLPEGSHVFASGATYISEDGSNPFGLSQPQSVVDFQTGSLYKHQQGTVPSFSGRTYADFELDLSGTVNFNTTFIGAPTVCSIDNLTITQGTFDFVFSAFPQNFNLNGVLTVNSGATFNYSPADVGAMATFDFNGSANGISGTGDIIFGEFSKVDINSVVALSGGTNPTINGVINRGAGSVVAVGGGGSFYFGATSVLNYNGLNSVDATLEWPNLGSSSGPSIINIDIASQIVTLNNEKEVRGVLRVKTNSALETSGYLTVKSGGSIMHGINTPDGGGSLSGMVKFQRKGTSNSRAYNFWSSPITAANVSVTGSTPYYYVPADASDLTKAGLRQAWSNASGTMDVGKGYIAKGGGTVTFNGTINDYPDASPLTITVEKPLTQNGTDPNPWNLVGNPFPSAIDVASFWTENAAANQITGVVYLWDDDNSGGSGYAINDYVTATAAGPTGPNSGTSFDGYIAAGQSFFIEKDGGTGSSYDVVFKNSMRSDQNDAFFRRAPIDRLWLNIIGPNDQYNETLIAFIADATDGRDLSYDAKKMKGEIGIFSFIDGEPYTIQAYPELSYDRIIPLGIDIPTNGTYTINLKEVENIDPSVTVILEDTELGTFQLMNNNPEYSFTATTGTDIQRFNVHFNPPVEVSTIEASCAGADGIINLLQPGNKTWSCEVKDLQGNLIYQNPAFNGSADIMNLNGGDYTMTLIDDHGYEVEKQITVDEMQSVTADFSASTVEIEAGEYIEFTSNSNGATDYNWNLGDGNSFSGMNSIAHTFNTPGVYTVTLHVSNNDCADEKSITVTVLGNMVGIGNINDRNTVEIWNVNEQVMIEFDCYKMEEAQVIIYNTLGQAVVDQSTVTEGTTAFDLNQFSEQYFIVRVRTPTEVFNRKLFLSH